MSILDARPRPKEQSHGYQGPQDPLADRQRLRTALDPLPGRAPTINLNAFRANAASTRVDCTVYPEFMSSW